MKKYIFSSFLILLLAYCIVVVYVYSKQEYIIFVPSRDYKAPPEHLQIENVLIKTKTGEKLHAWWLGGEDKKDTVIFFHGNGGNLTDRVHQMEAFKELNLNALMIDYRGYGQSTGEIKKEADIYNDGLTAYNFVINNKKIPEKNIIIWGQSLGGAVAINVAQNKNIKALITESTFYSSLEMARRTFWYLPIKYLLKYKFTSGDKIKNVKAPVLIMHSPDDGTIPFSQSEKLFQAANEPKEFFKLKGDHNSASYESYEDYIIKVKEFLEKK